MVDSIMISCAACGEKVSGAARSCPKCGHPISGAQRFAAIEATYTGAERTGHGFGGASLGCGIPGLILCWVPYLGLLLNALAFIFGILGMALGKKKGAAVTGFIFSVFGLIVAIVISATVGSVFNR